MLDKFKEKCKKKIQCAWKYSGYTLKWWLCVGTAFALGNTARLLCYGQQAVARVANETWRSRIELVDKSKVPVDQPIVDLEITDDVEDALFTVEVEDDNKTV